jgi:hypothetical protein
MIAFRTVVACHCRPPCAVGIPSLVSVAAIPSLVSVAAIPAYEAPPRCNLRIFWNIVYEKLANMVAGTRLAEDVLNRA